MSRQGPLRQCAIAISTSDSPDMPALGLSDEHLRDAMTEIARHLLALDGRLVYGGDLRAHGFSELLFELFARYGPHADEGGDRTPVTNYLAHPPPIQITPDALQRFSPHTPRPSHSSCTPSHPPP